MQSPGSTFGLPTLFWLVLLVAVLLAISRYSVLAAVALCPIMTGAVIAHALLPTRSAVSAGILSAAFWTFFSVCIVSGLIYPAPAWNATESVFDRFAVFYLGSAFVASLLGGYLGARVATS